MTLSSALVRPLSECADSSTSTCVRDSGVKPDLGDEARRGENGQCRPGRRSRRGGARRHAHGAAPARRLQDALLPLGSARLPRLPPPPQAPHLQVRGRAPGVLHLPRRPRRGLQRRAPPLQDGRRVRRRRHGALRLRALRLRGGRRRLPPRRGPPPRLRARALRLPRALPGRRRGLRLLRLPPEAPRPRLRPRPLPPHHRHPLRPRVEAQPAPLPPLVPPPRRREPGRRRRPPPERLPRLPRRARRHHVRVRGLRQGRRRRAGGGAVLLQARRRAPGRRHQGHLRGAPHDQQLPLRRRAGARRGQGIAGAQRVLVRREYTPQHPHPQARASCSSSCSYYSGRHRTCSLSCRRRHCHRCHPVANNNRPEQQEAQGYESQEVQYAQPKLICTIIIH